jgi:ferredoxin--NADP+ reductase
MVEDLAQGAILSPAHPQATAAEKRIRERQPAYFSYADWRRLNTLEVARGRAVGQPRVKFTRVEAMLAARCDSEA